MRNQITKSQEENILKNIKEIMKERKEFIDEIYDAHFLLDDMNVGESGQKLSIRLKILKDQNANKTI